jgi:hypothetical protein
MADSAFFRLVSTSPRAILNWMLAALSFRFITPPKNNVLKKRNFSAQLRNKRYYKRKEANEQGALEACRFALTPFEEHANP